VIRDCTLYHADCRDVLPALSGIDAVVTDPPYGIDIASRGTIGSGSTRFAPSDWDKQPIAPELMAKIRAKAPWQIIFDELLRPAADRVLAGLGQAEHRQFRRLRAGLDQSDEAGPAHPISLERLSPAEQ